MPPMRPRSRERARLTGGANANTAQATANGQAAAAANNMLGTVHSGGERHHGAGAYHYDPSHANVLAEFPPVSPDNYNLAQATITQGNATFFAKIFA
jgi:hypothetical protein